MPIRINLLAEQQAAEEARRRDPVKRSLVIGGALVVFTMLWTLMTYMQVKARRAEFANEDSKFKRLEEDSKAVRGVQAEVGGLERRLVSLERYSTNRILWANVLDAMQRATFDQIRLKSLSANQHYITNPPTVFFSTNLHVAGAAKPPGWKFWASPAGVISPTDLALKTFRSFTNQAPFSTNKLPYTVKTTLASTNLISNEIEVKCDFQLVAFDIEDIEVFLAGGDYGNPPGGSIDEFARTIVNLPYFKDRLAEGDEKLRFVERPPNAELDPLLPGSTMFKRFTVRLKYKDRVLTNE